MTPPSRWQAARLRSTMYRAVRAYFEAREYLEIETPILTPRPIPESHIQLLRTDKLYLVPSPEVWMKQALAEGSPSLYQIARCFRGSEPADSLHRSEFTMLEWYRLQAQSRTNIAVMQDLIDHCAEALGTAASPSVQPRIRTITMQEAFITFAGFSLEDDLRSAGAVPPQPAPPASAPSPAPESRIAQILSARLTERGLAPAAPASGASRPPAQGAPTALQGAPPAPDAPQNPQGAPAPESPADLFHRLFLTLVEPKLPTDRPLVLTQWPALIPTLARRLPGTPWADRWELYINGIEIANCYGEENSRPALEAYWAAEAPFCDHSLTQTSADNPWIDKIARGMPPCSGAAVGLDRLLAVLLGMHSLDGLDLFPINAIIPP